MEEDQRRRPPRAINIIRPSSPLLQAFRRPYFLAQQNNNNNNSSINNEHSSTTTPSITTAGSMTSSTSTWSSSSSSILSIEQQQAYNKLNGGFVVHNRPGSPFTSVRSPSPTGWSMIAKNMQQYHRPMSPLGYRSQQQHQHNYTPLSRIASALSQMSTDSTDEEEEDDDDDIDDDDSDIDNNSDDDITPDVSSSEEDEPEIVARMKQGCTILNGRGEFVTINNDHQSIVSSSSNRSNNTNIQGGAKLNRKIADLEIEIKSLSTVNASLEEKTRQQAARIAELERLITQRQVDTSLPPTPVSMTFSERNQDGSSSDEDGEESSDKEADQVFERIKGMLQVLIEQAQRAIAAQSKTSGRVLLLHSSSGIGAAAGTSIGATAGPANIMDFERASTPVRTQRQRSASRNSVVSCPPEIRARPANNRRSWPTVTASNSRLLRMATQPSQQLTGRQRSQSMVRANSSPFH